MLRLLADENFNGRIIDDLELLILASRPEELDGQIRFLPL